MTGRSPDAIVAFPDRPPASARAASVLRLWQGLPGLLSANAAFLLWCYLPYYVFRSMRVVYGEGRIKTTLKFLSISTIYFLLLGITMLLGLVATMLSLS